MKFGKEFVYQMVPEWEEAYLDYNKLKSLLKDIKLSENESVRRRSTLNNRVFSDLTDRNTINNEIPVSGGTISDSINDEEGGDIEDQVILVSMARPRGSEGVYETMFLMLTEEGGHNEQVFFRQLDDEFNKVNRFYKNKVEEEMEEAAFLNKQLDALDAFRIKVGKHPPRTHASDRASTSAPRESGKVHMDVEEEERNETKTTMETPLEILNSVKIKIPIETPYSTIKFLLKVDKDKDKELSFSNENLKKVEAQLQRVFIEFYQKLRHLRNYSLLNRLAMEKILKKYDKVCSRTASKSYLSVVDDSYIGNPDEVLRMMERVQATFIKHFSNSNRRRGMKILRFKEKKELHGTTFSLGRLYANKKLLVFQYFTLTYLYFGSGIFTGCTIALIVTLILIIRLRDIVKKEGFDQYMENMFPLYSVFGFIVLHMVMFAGNLYFWRRYRVNYSFIFGFKKGTEIGYRDVLFLSAGLATLALASVVANLDMEMDAKTKDYQILTELLPLGLIALITLIIVCPFNIIYRSSRFFLVRTIFRGICAPLYRGKLIDYFWGDQLSSELQALRSLEFYICYYGWGDFRRRRNTCASNGVYSTFYYIVAIIPHWTRLVQGFRHSYDVKDMTQAWNSVKHFITIVAILMRTAYVQHGGDVWWTLALIFSIAATTYTIYWDLVVDWELLRRRSKNRWLRDRLTIPHKSVYYVCIVVNVLLRFVWVQTVLNIQISGLRNETVTAIFSSLEIFRRGMWSYFRVEIEHVANVEKYRASKLVPHPFIHGDGDEATAMKGFSFFQFLR
ncbi:hypothetical protein ACHQM5_006374 [Ranunculus cassubicifolius]